MNLFGPVLPYDLVRMTRRGRYFLLRTLYVIALLLLLYMTFEGTIGIKTSAAHPNDLAEFASRFFYNFMLLQFFAVLLLTPAYVGGAIAEEKVRQTLDYLLTTDLTNREIILGKLVSRLANLALFFIAGLPILSLIQLFGGVSPELLWCGFAATLLSLISLSSISLWFSMQMKKPRDAIVLSYLLVICYYLGWGLLVLIERWLTLAFGAEDGFVEAFGAGRSVYESGNLIAAYLHLEDVTRKSGSYQNILTDLLVRYAIFHGAVTLLFTVLAIWRVRRVYIRQRYGTPQPGEGRKGRKRRRPPIHDDAMMWKERHIESRFHMGKIGIAMFVLLSLAVLGFGVFIFAYYGFHCLLVGSPVNREMTEAMNIYVRIAGTLLATLLVLAIGVRAAGSIGAEREKQTMDGLLSSPLDVSAIIRAKWWGSIHSGRWLFFLLGIVWCMGLITGGMSVLALPLMLALVWTYAAFMASLGLFFAAATKTSLRAMMQTLGTALFVGGGHWFCCAAPIGFMTGGGGPGSEWVYAFLAGLTPPAVLAISAFQGEEFRVINSGRETELFFIMACGVVLYIAAAFFLRVFAAERFHSTCGRIDGQPRGEPMAAEQRSS